MKKRTPKIELLMKDTYLKVIENSVGSKLFRNSYALVDGKKRDLLRNGDLSCAIFVSAVLKIFNLVKEVHHTVSSTLEDMKKIGWKAIKMPKEGSVIVWEKKTFGGETHAHIGFYIGNKKAVSNSTDKCWPTKHDITFKGKRKIEAIYWHKKING